LQEIAVPQAFLVIARKWRRALVVKSIFTLARQYPDRRL